MNRHPRLAAASNPSPSGSRARVDVRPRHDHVLGEAPPPVEPRLVLDVAEVLDALAAGVAASAAAAERCGHAFAAREPGHLAADGAHHAGELVPRDVRPAHGRVVAHPRVPVTAAHARGADLDDRPVGRWFRIGDDRGDERGVRGFDEDGAHGGMLRRP
jgi:hypothetical protein